MSTLSAIENAVCYIEDHLADALSISDLAKQSGYSEFYFQRLFSAVCEVSLGEYIRCRRMSIAAAELLNSDLRITELAYKYGYETPESFTKAFHRFHGASPSEIRQQKQPAKRFARIIVSHSTAPLAFHVSKRQLPGFTLIGTSCRFPISESIYRDDIPQFWKQCQKDQTLQTLIDSSADTLFKGIAACCLAADQSHLNYLIGTASNTCPIHSASIEIPACTWLCFKGSGRLPQVIQQAWHQIYTDYFPASNIEPLGNYDLEIYPDKQMDQSAYPFEIWVAIKESRNI